MGALYGMQPLIGTDVLQHADSVLLLAFSGLVPPAMTPLYPNASITNSLGWGGFQPTQVSLIFHHAVVA